MRTLPVVVAAVAVAGCNPPPEAPTELSELARYVYREWDNPNPEVTIAGLLGMERFLADNDLSADSRVNDRAWELALLEPDDVAGLPARPDRPLDQLFGVSVAHVSPFPPRCHALAQSQTDQLPFEPTATEYDRSFPEEPDPGCFADQSCDILYSYNDARRANAIISADFILHKAFRWFEYEGADGEPREAFYSRSWFEESFPGDNNLNTLWQSYSADLWIGRPDGTTWRYQTLWSETEVYLGTLRVNDQTQITLVKDATGQQLKVSDDAIAAELCPELAPE